LTKNIPEPSDVQLDFLTGRRWTRGLRFNYVSVSVVV